MSIIAVIPDKDRFNYFSTKKVEMLTFSHKANASLVMQKNVQYFLPFKI
jgi:hypothetical protein